MSEVFVFDFVRKHTRLFQFILLILILPSFALVGMQGYTSFMDGANSGVAMVDRSQDHPERMGCRAARADRSRAPPDAQSGRQAVRLAEVKREALEGLVRDRVLQTAAASSI